MIELDKSISQRQFADLIGVSEAAVSGMVKRELITQGQTSGEWIKDYCAHLRETAAGREASGDLDLATERARLAKAQRERIEMQNAVTRGELAPKVMMEGALARAASKIAGVFDAIPGMVRRRVSSIGAEEIDMIAGEIAKARNIVAAMSIDDINVDQPDSGAVDIPEVDA